MYKVLLADDDFPVIQYLMQEIPWGELNLHVIGHADDGLEAYHKAEEELPDILITDIGMPGMDGLTLIRKLKQLNPDMHIIIMSCHDDFKYTREALKLNVHDYVHKESMESKEIEEILKVIISMKKSRQDQQSPQEQQMNKTIMKEKLIGQFLLSPIFNEDRWQTEFAKFGVDISSKLYFPVVCYINHYDKQLGRFDSEELLIYPIINVIEEIIFKEQNAHCFRLGTKELLLLFTGKGVSYRTLKDIQSAMYQYLKVSVSFVTISYPCSSFTMLRQNINYVLEKTLQRFYLSDSVITSIEQLNKPFVDEDVFNYYADFTDEMEKVLHLESEDLLKETVSMWFRLFREKRYHPEKLKSFILQFVMDQCIKKRVPKQHVGLDISKELHQIILSMDSIYEMERWLVDYWESLLKSMLTTSIFSKRSEILKAQKYVMANLETKISLDEVSNLLHLNPAYFSRLYKKETQESFIKYVIRMKMEKAKEWLETTDKTVEEVAYKLGYDNKSYFNKCFKSIFNMPPSQLQQLKRNG
ncbi:response regulator transcription factor [Chengkuizengella axinellae]|uniref:Response regulator n=1 Tax=Chengkuizengella axinellae TaxID=3064388 RepID=A0ABT9IW06_9BACL|nr:response regulator [Chengkuizengella sp. 2205SS18-9]MDP5272999.1 response regulator [Chengkuizengella sp. 2205SS18-9]